MGIALIIVGGLTLTTLFATLFDYLGKRAKVASAGTSQGMAELEKRVASLEAQIRDRDERVFQIEKEVVFMTKLLDDKSKEPS